MGRGGGFLAPQCLSGGQRGRILSLLTDQQVEEAGVEGVQLPRESNFCLFSFQLTSFHFSPATSRGQECMTLPQKGLQDPDDWLQTRWQALAE